MTTFVEPEAAGFLAASERFSAFLAAGFLAAGFLAGVFLFDGLRLLCATVTPDVVASTVVDEVAIWRNIYL